MPRRRQVLQGLGGTIALAAMPRLARAADTVPLTPGVPDGMARMPLRLKVPDFEAWP